MKSLIYVVNAADQAVSVGDPIQIGATIRRVGCLRATNTAVILRSADWYTVDMIATFTAAAPGNVTITLYKDGVPVPGASATETITTANTEIRSMSIHGVVKATGCDYSDLTFVVSGVAPTITNVAVTVES